MKYSKIIIMFINSFFKTKNLYNAILSLFICTCIIYITNLIIIPNNSNSSSDSDKEQIWIESKENFRNSPLTLLEKRAKAVEENFDEFIEKVLTEIQFEEVILDKNLYSDFDEEIKAEFSRVRPELGENGSKIFLNPFRWSVPDLVQMWDSMQLEGLNLPLSRMISPNRNLPDTRTNWCKNKQYDLKSLPTLSVIIICHNEPLTIFSRTLTSLFSKTPESILVEVIIVDDVSKHTDLGEKFERYLSTHFPIEKIRLIRLKQRAGLIKARMAGAHLAIGDVLFFMDSHLEMENEWSEPLLERIKINRKTLVTPQVKSIDPEDFSYIPPEFLFISGFSWDGWFRWISVPIYERERKDNYNDPTRSPTMMGAAFAIDRKYFWSMGSFDPGMEVWGAENLELPFRIWLCGGSVELIPCSKVGHVYRIKHTYNYTHFGFDNIPTLYYNMARTAEVWLDEYKYLFYNEYPGLKANYGDISRRKALRENLNCKNFSWFMDNIYKEKFAYELSSKLSVQFKTSKSSQCMDSDAENDINRMYTPLKTKECQDQANITQKFYLSKDNLIHNGESGCLVLDPNAGDKTLKPKALMIVNCDTFNTTEKIQNWSYDERKEQIRHLKLNQCITQEIGPKNLLLLSPCNENLETQQWKAIPFQ